MTLPLPAIGPGVVIGHYALGRLIGRGGMGRVYMAEDEECQQRVAVKVVEALSLNDLRVRKRFMHEIDTLMKLDHPNIVNALDSGQDGQIYYLVMEYIEGENLQTQLTGQGPLTEGAVLNIARQIAQALDYAWQGHHILHRDIKPSNIMLDRQGRVHVLDLGLSKSLQQATELSFSGEIVGSPFFMSPEQAAQRTHIDIRSDMYSLGITLYNLLSGRRPFDGDSIVEVLRQHATMPLPDIHTGNTSVSTPCMHLIQAMTAKQPEFRPSHWQAVVLDIDRVLAGVEPRASAFVSLSDDGSKAELTGSEKRRSHLFAIGAVLVGMIILFVFPPWGRHAIAGLRVDDARPILWDPQQRTEFFSFCRKWKIRDIYLSDLELTRAGVGPGSPITFLADVDLQNFIQAAHQRKFRVFLVDEGHPEHLAASRQHILLEYIRQLIAYQVQAPKKNRLDGFYLDNHPFQLPGFFSPLRSEILEDYLNLNDQIAELIKMSDSTLQYGAFIPFWYEAGEADSPSEYEVLFQDERKSVAEHLIGIVDHVVVNAYRDTAIGHDGIIDVCEQELLYADAYDAKLSVSVDTMPYGSIAVSYVCGIPRERWLDFTLEHRDFLLQRAYKGFEVRVLEGENYVVLGLVQARHRPGSGDLDQALIDLSEYCRNFQLNPKDSFHARKEFERDLMYHDDHTGFTPFSLPDRNGMTHALGFRSMISEPLKVTFSDETTDYFVSMVAKTSKYLRQYKSYSGFILHNYASFSLFTEKRR